jgi:hypothetical protein
MLYGETSVAYSEIHKNHRNGFTGQNVEFLKVNPGVLKHVKEVSANSAGNAKFCKAICDCQCELHL